MDEYCLFHLAKWRAKVNDYHAEKYNRRPRPCLQSLDDDLWNRFCIANNLSLKAFQNLWNCWEK